MSSTLPITPKTKVAELLEAYPELEEILVAAAPPFEKLESRGFRTAVVRSESSFATFVGVQP